jgi:serine/threonine protein kinase
MRVCSLCKRCYDDPVAFCTDESHPPLSETRDGSPEMIAGYRLHFLLESGAKSDTYRARQTESGQPCLIKILSADAQNSQQFLEEAKLAATFFHPNVVDVYEAGCLDSGEIFVVSEDPEGETLRDVLNNVGVPELLTSIQVVRQAAEALHALHLKGLLHRAVKPENIILTNDAENGLLVRIQNIDFGGDSEHSIVSNKFLIDSSIDSLKYFAPEQCLGETVSARTDVYSLGIVFYEMLAGVPPFDASKAAGLIEKHRSERPPEIKIDNFDLRMLVTHSLMESLIKRPERRQSSANAFARQLRHIEQLATHISTPPPAGVVPLAPRPVPIEHEPVKVIRLDTSIDYLPEVPSPLFTEPVIENPAPVIEKIVEAQATAPLPRFSRLKLHRKRAHSKIAPPAPEIREQQILIVEEPVHITPTMIDWEQPEDIPSVAEVMEVMAREQIVMPEPQVPVAAQAEPEAVVAIPPAPKPVPKPAPKAAPKPMPVHVEEPEEITIVPARSRPIRIDWEQPVAARTFAPRASAEVLFFPTLLGDAGNRTTVDPGNSMFSTYYAAPSQTGFPISARSVMIGGGCLALIALFLFGGDLIGKYALTGNPSDSLAAETISAKETPPNAAQTSTVLLPGKKALKNFAEPRAENDDSATKPLSVKEQPPVSGVRSQTSAGQNAGKTAPLVPSKLVISSDNGKINRKIEPEKRSTDKTASPISGETAGATRPRIVKDPKP